MICDLHLHTNASDGLLSPTQMVNWAKEGGIDAIAVTDHDTVSGVDEAIAEGAKVGLKVLAGIEISSFSNFEIHMLGYNIDYKNPDFIDELNELKERRKDRNELILSKLSALGMKVEINARENGIGRMNIARKMIECGYVKDANEAFDRFLAPNRPAYAEVKRVTPLGAVKLIKKYGGIASIAHPKKYLSDGTLDMLVGGLLPFGLDAIETDYPSHSPKEKAALNSLARKYGLLTTGGSDFHGEEDKLFRVTLSHETEKALRLK